MYIGLKNKIKNIIPWLEIDKKIYKIHTKANYFYKKEKYHLANYYSHKIYRKYGCCIAPGAEIEEGLILPHPIGIVIGNGVKIGKNCTLYQNVTLGRKNKDIAEYPTIGNDVIVYCNSTIIGKIEIGDNSIIGCNTVVMKSVDKNSVSTGVVK